MLLNHPSNRLNERRVRRQAGIGLLESMLGLLIAGFMLLMLAQWLRSASDEIRAKRNADSLQQFTQVAVQYLDVNRDAITRAMSAASVAAGTADANQFCLVGAPAVTRFSPWAGGTGRATCAADGNQLRATNFLPAGSATTNPYGQSWVAIYRLVYADYDGPGPEGLTTHGDIEVLVVATGGQVTPNNELGMTMQLMGGIGGMYPTATEPVPGCSNPPLNSRICGPGGWQVDITQF